MKNNAILIVAGEPNSVFLEIFFKSFHATKYNSPIIIIASKSLIIKQMKLPMTLNFKSLQESIKNPNYIITDFSNEELTNKALFVEVEKQ